MTFFSAQIDIEFAYYYSPDGVQYPLFGGKRALMRFTGLEMPNINYISDSGPFVHGIRIRDFRIPERVIEFTQYERGLSRQGRWDNLGLMMDTIRPNRGGEGRILIVLPDGTEREINCYILEGPKGEYLADSNLSSWDLREALRFICSYPIFYDPNINEIVFPGTLDSSCLGSCLPYCIGSATIYSYTDIYYVGTFKSFPTITITGPLDTPIIQNLTTNKEIRMNYNISLGEIVTIQLNPNRALVYNNLGSNLIGTIEDTNDLATFAIEPAGVDIPGGLNQMYIEGPGAILGVTELEIAYYDNYLGVPK